MDHQVVALRHGERTGDQPFEQGVTVAGLQHGVQRVARAQGARTGTKGHGEQVQVVIAEHDDGVFAQRAGEAEDAERIRAAVHQVTHQPELVAVGGEIRASQERAQLLEAALHVADGQPRHRMPLRDAAARR